MAWDKAQRQGSCHPEHWETVCVEEQLVVKFLRRERRTGDTIVILLRFTMWQALLKELSRCLAIQYLGSSVMYRYDSSVGE